MSYLLNKTLRKLANINLLAQLEFTSCPVWHAKNLPTSSLTGRIMVPLWWKHISCSELTAAADIYTLCLCKSGDITL